MRFGVIDTIVAGVEAEYPVDTPIRQRGAYQTHKSVASVSRSAVTQSISPHSSSRSSGQPHLSNVAHKRLVENILDPILREGRFKFFHPLVSTFRSRSNETIKCLRDLEQSLIFAPLVSNPYALGLRAVTYIIFQTLAVSHQLYRAFGEFSIQLVVDTYHHLSESEQRRAADRPYDNGYFLDLVQQVGRLAAQIGSARQAPDLRTDTSEAEQDDEMAYAPYVLPVPERLTSDLFKPRDDEVTLEGGLGETGQIAELVRWKNGKGISLRTNEPYEPLVGMKRQLDDHEFDDDADRSMARRKKTAEAKTTQLKCSEPSCGKVFTRRCDLAKHGKTHSRPFKCPDTACKYHEQGLPTEKERDRHINDRHSADPYYYRCKFCSFKTKRDSNCKQHMEKKHDWTYERVKGNSKVVRTPAHTPQTPHIEHSPSIASRSPSMAVHGASSTSGSIPGSVMMMTPQEQLVPDLAECDMTAAGVPYVGQLFPTLSTAYSPEHTRRRTPYQPLANSTASPSFAPAYSPITPQLTNTPVTPARTGSVPHDSPYLNSYDIGIDYAGIASYPSGLPTPNSNNCFQPTSRNPFIAWESPMIPHRHQQSLVTPADFSATNNVLPMDDFALYDGWDDEPALTAASPNLRSGIQEMFHDMRGIEYHCADDNMLTIDDYLNIDRING